jgi:8-oxo-dGTP pyrophosphatase MutT (NUDIX family)
MMLEPTIALKFRSAGLIFRGQQILLHRGAEDDFWSLPGGTVEAGEWSDRALCREIEEETGISQARTLRLLWVAETRYVYAKRRYHEVGFYWLLDVPERPWPEHGGEFKMVESEIIFRWIALSALSAISIKPHFLRDGIAALPATTAYLQINDE